MNARMTRDFDAVEQTGGMILAATPGNVFVRRALARQFDELRQDDKALPHWSALHNAVPNDFEAAFHVARGMRRAGASVNDALAAISATGIFTDNLRAVLDAPAAKPPRQDARSLLICGVSYCGSTLFDRLLGSLPGAASIGESHWLVKGRIDAGGYDLLDFGRDFAADMVKCSVCGKNCAVLTAEFRRALAADRTNWYFRIAQRLGTQRLIACDKNPAKILDNDPLLRFDALVLFKSLPQAWWSELQKRKPGQDEAYYLTECQRYVTTWSQNYGLFLEHFSPQGKVVFLSFEEFLAAPAQILQSVCEALSLPFDEAVLDFARPGHAIGGNDKAVRRLKTAGYAPDIVPLAPPEIPDSHAQIIARSTEARRVFELLQSAHQRTVDRLS